MKRMNSTLLFSRFRKPENFRKLLAKEEEEEIQEDVQRDSKDVKDCNQLHHFEINQNVVNSVESFLKTNFATGNRLQ